MNRGSALLVALAALLLLSACGVPVDAPGADAADLPRRIVIEANDLRALFAGPGMLVFPLFVLTGWAASRSVGFGMRIVWRLGLDPERSLAAYRAIMDFSIAMLVAWAMAARLIRVAPVLSFAGLGIGLAALTVALREQVQDVAVGLALVGRRRLRLGDRVHVGEHAGTVHRVGLTRVELRRGDGTAIHVPTRLLATGALVVGHAKHTVPVAATVSVAPHLRDRASERARRVAIVSPYRAVASPIDVQVVGDGVLKVEIQVWSSSAARDAASQLEQALARALGPATASPRFDRRP